MTSYKFYQKFAQYMILSAVVVVAVALVSAISGYDGFLSLNVGMEGISLTVDGR